MVTFPVSCLLTAGVSLQDEGDREIVRADSIAEARKRIEHDVATVREDSERGSSWTSAGSNTLSSLPARIQFDVEPASVTTADRYLRLLEFAPQRLVQPFRGERN